ncbi:alpha/beta hydrolase fold protein-like protein [Massarina eburnea CBS 473.64]|uniref:Alpha/beta hydrolase fold protein-like protein n=1 Tax=Massarina eburnea CBS 473.64 TaxID=1395130 RepID=A0A6A6SDV0_9PLEO|nr:alpha/beta hydrolase fold protein-like protein [Massarina eburnea CBS 473.64]
MADQNVSRAGIASTTVKATLAASLRLWTSPFKGARGAPNYYKDVIFSMMRVQLASLNTAQERYINGTSTPVYLKYCEDHGLTPQSVTIGENSNGGGGVEAHWLGDPEAEKVILWFHGGGYVMPLTPAHFIYLSSIAESLNSSSEKQTAVLFLAYDLAPESTYPTQLRQAVQTLQYLVETTGRAPSSITLGGDSAGASLTLGVLSHVAHPHPEIDALQLPTKLHAALLISPWASFNTHTPAFERNAQKDCFDRRALNRWSSAYLGSDAPFAGDFYNEPVLAPAEWWEGTAEVVDEVLIWAGENEVLLDSIEELARRFEKGFGGKGGRVNTVITPKAAHTEMILELLVGYKGDSGTGSAGVVSEWARAKL